MRRLVLSLVILCVGCGDLSPDPPDSKLNNGGGSNATTNGSTNGSSNGATNGATNGHVAGGWDVWGTLGPDDLVNPKSAGGYAHCGLEEVRTDDLAEMDDATVPSDGWVSVMPDAEGRCGDDFETLAWRLMNCERIGRGQAPLECDRRMVWLGREHTLDMIERGFFRHANPDGEQLADRLERHGVSYASAGENLSDADDVLQAHYGWMDSSGHRNNILGDFTHAGVGSELRDDGRRISTTVFLTVP